MNASRPCSETALRPATSDDLGVTAVLGSIMILGITVVGITAILAWGAPAVQQIQEQGAQASMLGEFYELRTLSQGLSITDTSRIPAVGMSQGTFGIEPGGRLEFGADLSAGCTMDVISTTATELEVTITDCGTINDGSNTPCSGGQVCLSLHRIDVDAPARTSQYVTSSMAPVGPTSSAGGVTFTLTIAGADLRSDGWMYDLRTFGASVPLSQVWVADTDAHHWRLRGQTEVQLHHEGGAIFSNIDEGVFLLEAAPISEEAFGLEWFWFRMPLMDGAERSIQGKLSQEVSLILDASPVRISSDTMYRVRMSFQGDYAAAWCNAMLLRDDDVSGTWSSPDACAAGSDGRRVAEYVPMTAPHELEFTHAYIRTAI